MGAIRDFFRRFLRRPQSPREFVVRLFPGVEHTLLTGLIARVTRLDLSEVGAVVDLNRQAAMCIKSGELESVRLENGVWEPFWHSTPGTVFNTDGLRRKLKGPCMCRVAKQSILMVLSADDFVAELQVNQPLAEILGVRGEGYADPNVVLPNLPPTADHPQATTDEPDDVPDPPSAQRVAQRTLALTAVAARAALEMDAPQMDDADVHRQRIVTWIEETGVSDELEPDEWKVLQRPVGTLDQRALLDSMWRVEGLAVLAWAIGLHPLPPYDELVVPPELYESIGLFDSEAGKQMLTAPKLRSPEKLASMQEHLLAFHWRMRDFSLRHQAMDFVDFSRNCWFGRFEIQSFRVLDGDLAIGQSAISDAPEEAIRQAQSIALERHLAINWLMGYSEMYSETDTST